MLCSSPAVSRAKVSAWVSDLISLDFFRLFLRKISEMGLLSGDLVAKEVLLAYFGVRVSLECKAAELGLCCAVKAENVVFSAAS